MLEPHEGEARLVGPEQRVERRVVDEHLAEQVETALDLAADRVDRPLLERRSDAYGVAHLEPLRVGPRLVGHRLAVGEPAQDCGRALHEVERQDPVDRLRVDPGDTDLLALVLARSVRDGGDVRDAVDVAGGRHRVARDRREAVRVLEDHVALEVLVDRVRDRRLEAGGEDGHEGHEREPDHQRRGRRGGAAGLAHRVLAREPAGQPANALHRLARERRQRPDQPRREQRGREQDERRAAAEQAGGRAGFLDPAEQADEHERQPEATEQERGYERQAPARLRVLQLGLAQGRHRRDARGPQGGRERCHQRDHDPDQQRDDHRAGEHDRARVGQVRTDRLEERVDAAGEQDPGRKPADGAEQTQHERLDSHGREDLPARGSERAQHPELTRALRHRDREGVEDLERAHEQRDPGEHEQRYAQEAQGRSRCRPTGAVQPVGRSRRSGWAAGSWRSGRAARPPRLPRPRPPRSGRTCRPGRSRAAPRAASSGRCQRPPKLLSPSCVSPTMS